MEARVERVELLASAHDPAALLEAFAALPFAREVLARGPDRARVRLEDGTEVRLAVLPDDDARFFAALAASTAGAPHLRELEARAAALGLALGPQGLRDVGGLRSLGAEEDLYAALDLPVVPPELRREARPEPAPPDLLAMGDVRGLVHVHTRDGRGAHPAAAMVARARREGFGWVLLADRGLDAARTAGQGRVAEEARRAARAEGSGFDVVLGAEAPIGAAGRLELEAAVRASVELVIAAPGGSAGEVAAALSDPAVKVLGHPREPDGASWATDLEAWLPVLDAAARHRVALEVSGHPRAVPLPEGWHAAARARGLDVLPAADAHDLVSVEDVQAAVGLCRAGRWPRQAVPATRDASGFRRWIREEEAT
jgi:DNA polymerase (family 10)